MDGLECLKEIDQLLVRRKAEPLESEDGPVLANRYVIENNSDEIMYRATEEPNVCVRLCFGHGHAHNRPFQLTLLDRQRRKTLIFMHPLLYKSWRLLLSLQRMDVLDPDGGDLVGRVQQGWFFGKPWFKVMTGSEEVTMRIEGPWLLLDIFKDVKFKIVTVDGDEIGEIVKKKTGCVCQSAAHHFGITFPKDLDVTMKATLIGAVILIDFVLFHNTKRVDLTSLLLL
ncbi:phospholipid scramblase 2-like [Ochlerotatus camptorhynchus]|uniref:phospholipid scramblase 2-like n=1 Tax=Ochlerotatus camptorhynchus TaxID=644619 RepID=UPI0031DDC6A9